MEGENLVALSEKISRGELKDCFVTNHVPTKEALVNDGGFIVLHISGAKVVTTVEKLKGGRTRRFKELAVLPSIAGVTRKYYVFDKKDTARIEAYIKEHIDEEPFVSDKALTKHRQ